jgi:hypothetical protein
MRANRPIMILAVAAAAGLPGGGGVGGDAGATSRRRGRVATARTVTTGRSLLAREPENPTSCFELAARQKRLGRCARGSIAAMTPQAIPFRMSGEKRGSGGPRR